MAKKYAEFPLVLLVLVLAFMDAPGLVSAVSGAASKAVAISTPNAQLTELNSQITFTPYGVYVRDGIYFRAGNNGLSYLLLEVPNGTHPTFYDYTGYLKTTFTGNIANVTLSSPLYANESWEVYASYTYKPAFLLLSKFLYHPWFYNASIGNVTIFAYSPAISVTGVPKGWEVTTYDGLTHQEVYLNATDVKPDSVDGLVIIGYQTGVTLLDFILTFVIIAFVVADGALLYLYYRKVRSQNPVLRAPKQLSQRVVGELSSVSGLVTSVLEARKQLPIRKGDLGAVNRWISSTKQRLQSAEDRLDSLAVRLTDKSDVAAVRSAEDYLQMIIVDMNNLFELDLRFASKKISERSYRGIEKQRIKSIYRSLERINELLGRREEE